MEPLYMKTYGKQSRKISAWISPPRDRKKAFESTLDTEGDVSVFEPAAKPAKIRKTTAARSRAARPVKKKALPCRTERSSDEENIPSPSCPQQSKTSRKKMRSVCSRVLRPVKRKAILCLTETSSDEEDISRPSPPHSLPAQQSKKTRNSRLVSEPAVMMTEKCQQVPVTGESVEEPTNGHKNSVQMKTDSSFHPPSASRFVTRRRCTVVAAKPKHPNKATLSTLNSSDDFAAGAFGSSRLFRPSRKRRRGPPAFLPLSAESSVNAAGTASFATTTVLPFQEISLNEWADQGLVPGSRKPIFCSTPSAGPYSQRQRLKPLSIHDSSTSPPSMSVSCIGVVSTFQDDPDSPPPPPSAPTIVPPSGEKPQSSFGEQEPDQHHHKGPSSDVFTERKISSGSGEEAKSLIEEAKNVTELPSLILLSTDESECSSSFVSAAGGLQWLVEALTEQCLTQRCTVQLERLDPVTVTQQLCSQSPYSSCLEHSSSVHSWQTKEHTPTVDLSQSSEVEPSLNLRLSVTNGLTSAFLQSVNGLKSPERAASETDGQSIDNASSLDLNQTASALIVESEAVNDTSLTKNVTVQLGKDHTQSGSTDDQEDLACSGRKMPPFETEALTAKLKENCLTDELHVKVKRVTASQLKGILKGKASTDVSDSASDEQTNQQPPESDINGPRHKDTSSAAKVQRKKRRSTSSEDKTASDKETVVKNVPHTRKKTSLAPKEKKRRSTSADRPGTTRKACVSGLSVSRWKSKDAASTHVFRSNMAGDCSINDLISTQRQQPQELLGSTMNFCTPVRTGRLNLSSLLTDLTPNNTHTWSRLKAALSVHRKGMVLQTPKGSRLSGSGAPGRVELADASQDLFATSFRTPLRKRFRSQLLSNDSLVPCEEADLSDAEKVYAECGQQRPLAWEECILPERMKACVKIGEGTFGEVFSTTNVSGDTVALKIIPLEGREKVNGEDQKTLGEILHEIIISKELSSLKEKQKNQTHGFIGLNDLHCVQGCYPPDFLKAWDTFDQKKGSENDRPDFFEKDQLFIILEFEFGGSDLENSNGALASLRVAKSILHQVTAAMAVAEQELHFEHRDLHWGNVLVKPTKQKTARFLLNGAAHSLESKGVLVRIIDYSLSRLEIDGLTVSCDISQDEELFMGQGDYQFDIYRLMRQENGNNWGDYRPHSNVLWLHYLCSKLLSMKYRGSGGKGAKDTREELTGFCDNLLQYSSATETLQKSPMFH